MQPGDFARFNQLREERQALRDQHYRLDKRNAPAAALKRLENQMVAIDKELDKLTERKNNWKKDTTPNP